MADEKFKALLGQWEGYSIGTVGRREAEEAGAGAGAQVWIELHPKEERAMFCSGCGRLVEKVHDVEERWVRDLPILDGRTYLLVHRCRVACPACGPKLEHLEWLPRYARVTARLAESVARLCRVLPIKHVAEFFDLSWDTVKEIDKAYLHRTLGPVDLSGVEQIAIDEFSIRRGHRFATVIVEPATKRVLWVGLGRTREEVRPFFKLLGEEGCKRLKAAAMDMSGPFRFEVQAQCPNVQIVHDLFHVAAKYARDVIDRVRVDEANRLKHDKPARRIIKGSRWLLLRNKENLTDEQDKVQLQELLEANQTLMTVYVLKDDLKQIWNCRDRDDAERCWDDWYSRASASGIKPLIRFARNLQGYLGGILSHCLYPLNTSLLEGINNKIKVIKRMAYGFRDHDYFFLKIRQAFPGNTG